MDQSLDIETFLYTSSQWAKKKYAAQIAQVRQNMQNIPENATEEMIDGHVMTEFLFRWINPDTKITPAEEFAQSIDDEYDRMSIVKYVTQLFYDRFRVLKMSNAGFGLVDSIDTAKTYHVIFRVGYGNMNEGDVFAGYIHPWYDGTYCTIGLLVGLGRLPPEFITPGMSKKFVQRFLDERQERYESVSITAQTNIASYLKSQSADHVTEVAKSLDVASGTKKQKIQRVRDALVGSGIVRAVESLPASHVKCLETVAAAGTIKRHILKRRIGDKPDIITELYLRGLLMLGAKTIGGRRHKVVAVPADVLYNAVERGLLDLRR